MAPLTTPACRYALMQFELLARSSSHTCCRPVSHRSLGGFTGESVSIAGLTLDELADCGLAWDGAPWWAAVQEVGSVGW